MAALAMALAAPAPMAVTTSMETWMQRAMRLLLMLVGLLASSTTITSGAPADLATEDEAGTDNSTEALGEFGIEKC